MEEEPEREPKKFLTPRKLFLTIASGAVVLLFVGSYFYTDGYAVGKIKNIPLVADAVSLFRETFGAPKFLAEVPLGETAIPNEPAVSKAVPKNIASKTKGIAEPPPAPKVVSFIPPICEATTTSPTHTVLINEIAWAGTGPDKTANEWIELKNNAIGTAHLAGWQLTNKSGDVKVLFGEKDSVDESGYFLLERSDDGTLPAIAADKIFLNSIKNADEVLRLFDAECHLADEAMANVGTGKTWPGGTASPEYRSMERALDFSWHTFSGIALDGIYGTPLAMNSAAFNTEAQATGKPVMHPVDVPPVYAPPPVQPVIPTTTPVEQTNNSTVPLISEIMVGVDGNSSYEFIELYNPGTETLVLTGWSMKKKSSTGTESSLVAASRLEGKAIPAGKYFLLAHDGGYDGGMGADVLWPASYSLAYTNNSVVLIKPDGTRVEEVTWTEIPAGKSFARVSWDSNQFTVADIPTPQNSQ